MSNEIPEPVHRQIANTSRENIRRGFYKPNDRFPSADAMRQALLEFT